MRVDKLLLLCGIMATIYATLIMLTIKIEAL